MYANVLKFHSLIHEKIGDRIFFLSQLSPILELFPFDKITYICTVVTVMGKQCWESSSVGSQAVLESSSVRVRQLGA